ncbi:MAG: endonuclease Q family protein [Candidatus Thorarchaeota archaeon]
MKKYAADLHIHSLHSIGVSKNMTIPNLAKGAISKGISLIGTGDATQPDWLKHIESTLERKDGLLSCNGIHFIPSVEFEDKDSIHHVILLPDFEAVHKLRSLIAADSPNLNHEWGGRPRVNLQAEAIAGHVRDVGGMIGPAHAFTPFKAIFREGKYDSIKDCYGSEADHIHFLELGLSADTEIADFIPELRRLTYITSSDAHSPSPDKLGREFVVLEMTSPSFDEVRKALMREGGRSSSLNLGLNPMLGKYYLSFCSKCRRTVVIQEGSKSPSFDSLNIYISCKDDAEHAKLLADISKRAVKCPSDGKPLRLGVRDRAAMLGEVRSKSPKHRPPYLHIPPLLDIIQTALGTKSNKVQSVKRLYKEMIGTLGTEVEIYTSAKTDKIYQINERLGEFIDSYRKGKVRYVPGGGGRYGTIVSPWEAE